MVIKLRPVRGWILDVYPSGANEMAVGTIAEDGSHVRLVDKFSHRIYVSGNLQDLQRLREGLKILPFCQ